MEFSVTDPCPENSHSNSRKSLGSWFSLSRLYQLPRSSQSFPHAISLGEASLFDVESFSFEASPEIG